MADEWKTIFKGEVEGRPVEIEVYDEGGYRINTTQGEDDPGYFETEDGTTTHLPPTEKGRPISIEGETTEELNEELLSEGFSQESIDFILGKIDEE